MTQMRRSGYRQLGTVNAFWLYRPKILFAITGAIVATLMLAALALTLGSHHTDLAAVFAWQTGSLRDDMAAFVLGQLRSPRILLGLISGMMLGIAGAAMQSVTRNSLADPGLIGVKEGAVVTVLGLLLFVPEWSPFWRPFAGLAGGLVVSLIVILLARSLSGLCLLLIGIGVSWLISSATALFMTMARIEDVQTAMIWLGGSLHAASWIDLQLVAPWATIGFVLLMAVSRSGDAAALGPMAAVGLGVGVGRLNAMVLMASVAVTAASASVVGGLGFVGLIAPHLSRLLFGSRQMTLIAGSAVFGATLVLAADTIGRVVFAPIQIPAGIVMAILGVPFFLFVLWQRRQEI